MTEDIENHIKFFLHVFTLPYTIEANVALKIITASSL